MARAWTFDEFVQSLEQRLDALQRGQVLIQDLPSAVSAWYFAGEAAGRASRQSEIDQLVRAYEQKLDMAYMWAFTPKERREEYQRRLDKHFKDQDAAFFAAPAQLNSSNFQVGADTLSAVERRPHDGSIETRGARAA